jgi:hypothetical protein
MLIEFFPELVCVILLQLAVIALLIAPPSWFHSFQQRGQLGQFSAITNSMLPSDQLLGINYNQRLNLSKKRIKAFK